MPARESIQTTEERLEEFRENWTRTDVDFFFRDYVRKQLKDASFSDWNDDDIKMIHQFANYICRRIRGIMAEEVSEDGLRKMLKDPRYWRDNNPIISEKIQRGFNKLYGGTK